jgi:hypothetical protein
VDRAVVRELVEELEAEVNNGGFDQYFFNSSGRNAAGTLEALRAIGAQQTADIVRGACAKFSGGMPPVDRDERQAQLLDAVSPAGDAFARDDEAFWAHDDDLAALLAAFGV